MNTTDTQSRTRKTDIKFYSLKGELKQYDSGLTLLIQASDSETARSIADEKIRSGEFSGVRTGNVWRTEDILCCQKVELSSITLGKIGEDSWIDSRNLSETSKVTIKTDAESRVTCMQYSCTRKSASGGKSLKLEDVSVPVVTTGTYQDGCSAENLKIRELAAGSLYEVTLPRDSAQFTRAGGAADARCTAAGFDKITVTDSDLTSAIGGNFTVTEKQSFQNSKKKETGTLREETSVKQNASGTFTAVDSLSSMIGSVAGFLKVTMEFVGGLTSIKGGNLSEKMNRESTVSADNWTQEAAGEPWVPSKIFSSYEKKTVTETAAGTLNLYDCEVDGNISGFSKVNIEFSPETWYHILDTDTIMAVGKYSDTTYRPWPILEDDKTVENIYGGKTVTVTESNTVYDNAAVESVVQTILKTETVTGSLSVTRADKVGADIEKEAIRGFKNVVISSCGEVGFITGGNRVTMTAIDGTVTQTLRAAGSLTISGSDNIAGADGFLNVTLNHVSRIGSITVGASQEGIDQTEVKTAGSKLTINTPGSSGYFYVKGRTVPVYYPDTTVYDPVRPWYPVEPVYYLWEQEVTEITGQISGYRTIAVNGCTKAETVLGTKSNDSIIINGNKEQIGMAVFGHFDLGNGKDTLTLKNGGVFATDLDFIRYEKPGENSWSLEKITGTGTVIVKEGIRESLMQCFKLKENSRVQVVESANFSRKTSQADVWDAAAVISGETGIQCEKNWLGFCNNIDYYRFRTEEIPSLAVDLLWAEEDQNMLEWSLQKYNASRDSWQYVYDKSAALLSDTEYRICVSSAQGSPISQDYSGFTIAFKSL